MGRLRRYSLIVAITAALLCSFTALSQATAHISLPFHSNAICSPLSIIVREEQLADGKLNDLPPLEDGDILLTDCAHSFGWRHGHAGLVVDAEHGVTVEAVTCHSPSALQSVQRWRHYPTFTVLRLKDASPETRQAAARYAMEHLVDVDYSLVSGFFGEKAPEELGGGQCAYLVWYAYQSQGFDLDSDGGKLVTVKDLLLSPLLETAYQVGTFA